MIESMKDKFINKIIKHTLQRVQFIFVETSHFVQFLVISLQLIDQLSFPINFVT